jgi:hypothetical protein
MDPNFELTAADIKVVVKICMRAEVTALPLSTAKTFVTEISGAGEIVCNH